MDFRKISTELGVWTRRQGLRLGWMGVVAGALLVIAGVEYASVTLAGKETIAELQMQVRRMQESSRSGREIKRGDDANPVVQIAAFERFFPPAADVNLLISQIYGAAEKESLVLERGEYRLNEEAGLGLLRYQITLPVKGSYASINAFARRVLRDIPALSLDGVSLQRPNIGEPAIEGQVRLSLFYQGAR